MSRQSAFDASQIDGIIGDLSTLGEDLNEVVEKSLIDTARSTSQRLQQAVSDTGSYPAQGDYSTGLTQGMVREPEVIWTTPTSCFVRWGLDLKKYGETYRTPVYVAYGVNGKFDGVSGIRRSIFSKSILTEFQDKAVEAVEEALGKI